ncbi:MAG: hypothetical protein NZL98_09615 [Anaerolineales bacterium]|nr:hypothetical protein [Anaerolineales bacterium]MDW8227574.1 hypothetical protein [Anaerolineales bacterium]
MKKILLPLILVVLLAVSIIPAAAGQSGPGTGPQTTPQPAPQGQGTMTTYRQSSPRGTFTVTGKVTAVDAVNKTITLTVLRSNKLVKAYVNTDVTIVTTSTTKFLYKSTSTATATKITLSDIQVGDYISATGTVANNVWTTTRVTEGATLSCLP